MVEFTVNGQKKSVDADPEMPLLWAIRDHLDMTGTKFGCGLGAILRDGITFTDGKVDQSNFDSYLPLRITDMPKIEVYVVPSGVHPSGVGEPGMPPLGPALANAVFALYGKRVTELPMSRSNLI